MLERFDTQITWKTRFLNKLLSLLPRETQHRLIRRAVSFPNRLDPRLKIKVAQTQEELSAAFQLVHEAYVAGHVIAPDPSGINLTPHHALPVTKTIVATWDGEVIACISLTPDSQFGLPMSHTFDLALLRRSDRRIVEAFHLAVHRDFQANFQTVVLPLFKYVYHFLEKHMVADYLVIAAHPRSIDFYEAVLLFTRLTTQSGPYLQYINGLPTVAAYLNVKTHRLALNAQYKDVKTEQNPLAFLSYSFTNLIFPDVETFQLTEPTMSPEVLDYFFNKRTNLFSRLSPDKLDIIASLYNQDLYGHVLPNSEVTRRAAMIAREPRFHVELQARLITLDGKMMPLLVHDVSLSGFKAEVKETLSFGEPIHMTVAIGECDIVDVRAIPIRQGPNGTYGFQITQSQQGWRFFIEMLEQERQNQLLGAPPSVFRISKVS